MYPDLLLDNKVAMTTLDPGSLSSPQKKHSAKKRPTISSARLQDYDAYDIRMPQQQQDDYTTLLVQIHPEDAAHLDFTGVTGVIGRLEVVQGEQSE